VTTTPSPFAAPSPLPYGLPPFGEIREEHYRPALLDGFAEHRAEVAAIAADPDDPTFENTVLALEKAGRRLDRAGRVFWNVLATDTTESLQALEEEMTPVRAAHRDAVNLDAGLFARVDALHARRDELGLDPVERRLLEHRHRAFVRGGAQLSEKDQETLRALNEELAALGARFDQNLLAANRAGIQVFDHAGDLAGLPADAVAAALANGEAQGMPGKYVLSLKNFSTQTQLASLDDRTARERLMTASVERAWDTNGDLIVRMAELRARRAALFGYPNHAAYMVADRTAGTTEAVEKLMRRLIGPAVANAAREAEALRAIMPEGMTLEPWDWAYYSEKVRQAEYDADAEALRPYLELDRVLVDGVFHAAGLVYGVTFEPRPDLAGYMPDVRVWEVFDADGTGLGLYLGDYYARPAKQGGAWMEAFVDQSHLLGQQPVVFNNLNVAKPPAGQPTLLTWDEVNTLFHEFGHALHALFSDVTHPTFSGTEVPTDFVEYPSQVNEVWAAWPEVLAHYARHHVTGEPIPAELVDKARRAERFGQGFAMVEVLAATMLDWAWHTVGPDEEIGDPRAFEEAALRRWGLLVPEIPPRYRSAYYSHVWGGGYDAGYYSYTWSEVLDKDTAEWFKDSGLSVRECGDAFRASILSKGGSVDLMAAYAEFRGRGPEVGALLAARGLAG
jgi:peptidyl-dipeptidase Dcp